MYKECDKDADDIHELNRLQYKIKNGKITLKYYGMDVKEEEEEEEGSVSFFSITMIV